MTVKNSRRGVRSARVLVVMAIVGLVAGLFAVPAQAESRKMPFGWYGDEPMVTDECSDYITMATGSDHRPMQARVCLTYLLDKVPSGNDLLQASMEFVNTSRSAAKARVTQFSVTAVPEQDPTFTGYECGDRLLPAYGHFTCVSPVGEFPWGRNLTIYGVGVPTVNGYGRYIHSQGLPMG